MGPGVILVVAHGPNGPRDVGDGFGGVRDIFVERRLALVRRYKPQLQAGIEIERRGADCAAARATRRPAGQASPSIRSCLEDNHGWGVGLGRVILEVLVEERLQDLAAEVEPGVAVEP